MNAYLLIPLIQVLFCLALIPIVLKGHFRNATHRLFSVYLLSLAIWGIIIFFMRSSPDVEHAYSVEKWLLPLGPFMAVFSYHFSVRYTATKVKSWLLPSAYLICLILASLVTTDLIISGMQLKPYGYAPVFGSAAPFYILFVTVLSVMALLNFIRMWKTSAYAEQRNRAAYITIGILFSLIGGAFDVLPVLGLPLYPGVIIGNTIFCLLTTVAIVKHNLLDIRVVLRKGTAYVLTSAVAAVPFIVIFLLTTKVFIDVDFPLWVYFVVAIALALILPQLWQRVQRWVDSWYFRDRYDYLKALETFSQQTQSLTDYAGLGSTMVNLLAKALRSSNVYLLQPLPPDNDFTTVYTNGSNNPAPAVYLKKESAIVKWLERSNGMLSYGDIEIIPQLQGTTSKEKQILQQVSAELIFPLKAPTGQLSGILILGKKLSEQPYNSEDKQLIYTICNHMSTNLENMRLYNESQQEVKERKQAEESLRLQQAYFQQLFDNSPDAIVMLDNTDRVVQINDGFERLFGYQAEEIKDRFINELIIPEDNAEEAATLSRTALCGKAARVETVRKCRDGSLIDVSALGYPIHFDSKTVGVYVIYSDITERKQAEEREKELQRELYLSSRLASIGELAAGVAHQLNNPLTGVLGFSQRLLRKSTDEEANQDLKRIYTETERAAKIVQNLLTFARRRQPNKEYSDVNNIVQSALELRAYELKTSNIEVITNLAPDMPKIMLDFHQIQEVFLNLILNAEQAMTEANSGGKLTIKTEKNKGYVMCTFSDDGPGISPENLDNVFDPFFTTKGERGGTGLGLSVCHGIIGEHGGKIYAKIKPNKGATFFVEFPITTKE
jgi:two-component system NtrC family sensor kinase